MLSKFIAFATVPMISTPTIVPTIVPTPPESETPPSTQAEMTSRANPSGGFGCPLVIFDATITPANPATRP